MRASSAPTFGRALPRFLIPVLLAGRFLPALGAEPSLPAPRVADGAIVGIVTNSAKVAIAGATVTAVKSNGGGIRATISGSDGVYSFADVPVGSWVITVHVDGEPDAVAPTLEVTAGKASRKIS